LSRILLLLPITHRMRQRLPRAQAPRQDRVCRNIRNSHFQKMFNLAQRAGLFQSGA
jgi:hypothetical protein